MRQSTSAKSTSAPAGVEAYLARVPEPARGTLNTIRAVIRSTVPAALVKKVVKARIKENEARKKR